MEGNKVADRIAVVTDSNSGITQKEARELGIYVIPNPFFINGDLYLEELTLQREEFFQKLTEDAEISTSQPAPGDILDLWDKLLKEYDEIVHIPLSSALSSAYETTVMLSKEYEGRIFVINNQRISVTQKSSAMDALNLVKAGKSAAEIKAILEEERLEASIYIMVDTLKYLKKGGRITPAAAAVGSVLNIKPVLQIQGDKLDSYAKVRGVKAAKKVMLEALDADLKGRFANKNVTLYVATTCDQETTESWRVEVQEKFSEYEVKADYLSLSVSCHTGLGALGVSCAKNV